MTDPFIRLPKRELLRLLQKALRELRQSNEKLKTLKSAQKYPEPCPCGYSRDGCEVCFGQDP